MRNNTNSLARGTTFSLLDQFADTWKQTSLSLYTVKPRLSGLQLSGNTAIRTVCLGNEKTQRKIAQFIRKSVFPEPDSSLGNQTMFIMNNGPCYPDTRQSVIDFKGEWQYKHCVTYSCLIGDSITFVNR